MDYSTGDWSTPVSHVKPFLRAQQLDMDDEGNTTFPTPYMPVEEGPLSADTPLDQCAQNHFYHEEQSPPEILQQSSSMELQMSRLQDQVSSLTTLLHSKMGTTTEPSILEQENSRLREVRAQLLRSVEDSETRLSSLQESVVQLQEEYRSESEDLQAQISELASSLESIDSEKAELIRDKDRAVKGKAALESYINSLPSKKEYEDLRDRLRLKEDENGRFCQKVGILSVTLDKSRKSDQEEKRTSLLHLREVEDLRSKVISLEEVIGAHERRCSEAGDLDEVAYENVLRERDELKIENERLKKFIVVSQKRSKRDSERATKKIEDMEAASTAREELLDTAQTRLAEELSTNKFLREDLGKSKVQCSALQKRSEALEREVEEMRHAEDNWRLLDTANLKLGVEISGCLEELQCLTSVTKTIVEGNDPNISALLGLKNFEPAVSAPTTLPKTFEMRRELLDVQRAEMASVRKDIAGIREGLSERYAENIGNDVQSCITQ